MRIVIDLQGLQTKASAHRGVGRYTENVVKHLLKNNDKHEFFLALNGCFGDTIEEIREKFLDRIPEDHFVVWQNYLPTAANSDPNPSLVAAAEIIRDVFLNSLKPDIIFSTNLQEGHLEPAVASVRKVKSHALYCTTLHDLAPFYYKEHYATDPIAHEWYNQKIENVKASDIILTPSHASKKDIVDFLSVDETKVFVASNGYDANQFEASPMKPGTAEKVSATYELKKPFILYVGGNDIHKNIDRLISAYGMLTPETRENTDLVLVGKEFQRDEKLHQKLAELGLTNNVRIPGFIAEEHLSSLFKMCQCFVFPSTHEGFGLPALEAMACGAPVIGSNSSGIKEVIETPEALFDPFDDKSIAHKIELVLSDAPFRQALIENGLKQAQKYSWANTAKTIVEVFEKFDGNVNKKGYYFGEPIDNAIRAIARITPPLEEKYLIDTARSISDSFSSPGKPKLHLDVSAVIETDHKSGIQRVTRAIAAEFLKTIPPGFDVELVYSSPGDINFYAANQYMRKVFGRHVPPHDTPVEFKPQDILLFLDLHPGVAIFHRDYIKHLRNRGVKVYHVVHDILPVLRPGAFWPEMCEQFGDWLVTISSSDGALCVSRTVAGELKEWLQEYGSKRKQPFKCGYFHNGADLKNSAPTKGFDQDAPKLLDALKSSPSFLMVGTVEPRKGHRQALAAFELLWNEGKDLNLVIVGRLGWGMHDFSRVLTNHSELGKRLFWLQGISDEYLEKVYQTCLCLIAPSEAEGFGLPLIEAAQHKMPILVRDISVFREVAGDYAYYFPDELNPKVLADAILNWLSLHATNSHPKSDLMPWNTWKQSVMQMQEVIFNDNWLYSFNCKGSLVAGRVESHRSNSVEWKGFGEPEQGFTWSSGTKAEIVFRWGVATDGGQLSVSCFSLGEQRVTVSLNGVEFLRETLDGNDTHLIGNLPPLLQGENVLTFDLPDARQPDEKDQRFLALALRDFRILLLDPVPPNSVQSHQSTRLHWGNFYGAEEKFRWTNGQKASIAFKWADSTENVQLRTLYTALGEQRVTLFLNRAEIYSGTLRGNGLHWICALPSLRVGYNLLELLLPDARIPGEQDLRALALAIHELEITVSASG
jgi:glycosyltransferase involved in cell wall biosynthesis